MNKITLTVRQLVAALDRSPTHQSALQTFFQLPKPIAVSWANRKLIVSCNEGLKLYHEHRLALCDKRGTLNPKTNNFDFETPEVRALFEQELSVLQGQTIELEGTPVTISDLGGSLSDIDLALLEPFLVG
jgi:hypothetical protein